MRVHHALELGTQQFGFGRVHADAGAAACGRYRHHVEAAALARDHGRKPPRIVLGRRVRAQELAARGAVEQLDPALDRLGAILCSRPRGHRPGSRIPACRHRRAPRPAPCTASISVRRASVSSICLWWRSASSASSYLMPLTSAQPQHRPSPDHLALGFDERPASVVSVIAKPTPRARKASTDAPCRAPVSGSSQVPKASTRCGASACRSAAPDRR